MYYFLEAEGAAMNGTVNMISTLVLLVAMVAIFYFFMYRPQKKQEKETKSMLDSLQVGKIVSIKDETVLIETTKDCTKIRILRTAGRHVDVKAEDAD